MKSLNALFEAQKIAFSPFVFETAYCMLELGILECIHAHRKDGISIEQVSKKTNVSEYGVRVLMEMAESADIIERKPNGLFRESKTGYYILQDQMTQVNLYFTHDVCYKGLFHLKEAIKTGKPAGLKELGDWKTLYEGLASLPEKVKKSWFEFDHFYSDNSFEEALKVIFKDNPKTIFDIGGNTGKWAIASTNHNPSVVVNIFDLHGQIKAAKKNIGTMNNIKDRIKYYTIDLLDPNSEIPEGADVYWMSQFLDCFGVQEIEDILIKIKKNMSKKARVYIMETFIDNQRFPAATYSLVATSLYFTAIANGNSKMYNSETFKYISNKAGFKCVKEHHLHDKSYHTILELRLI